MSWGLIKSTVLNYIPHAALHVHDFSANTKLNFGHIHIMSGTTAPACGGLDDHIHYYSGTTSISVDHFHYFRGWTGPAIPLTGGGHGHWFMGTTSFNDKHSHYYHWFTGREIPLVKENTV